MYTKNQIEAGIFRLLKKKSFGDITVTEICSEAQVSRPAFYRNFYSKEDVIAHAVNSVLKEKIGTLKNGDLLFLMNDTFIYVWGEQKQLIEILYENDLMSVVSEEMSRFTMTALPKYSGFSQDPVIYEYLAIEMSFLVTSILYGWAKRGFTESTEDLKKLTDRLFEIRMGRKILADIKETDN